MRDRAGICVGGTAVVFEPSGPSTAFEQNTGIDAAHRGPGLAKWAKATMLERIRNEHADVRRIHTDNAFSNAPMRAISDALGCKVLSPRTEWRGDAADVRHAFP